MAGERHAQMFSILLTKIPSLLGTKFRMIWRYYDCFIRRLSIREYLPRLPSARRQQRGTVYMDFPGIKLRQGTTCPLENALASREWPKDLDIWPRMEASTRRTRVCLRDIKDSLATEAGLSFIKAEIHIKLLTMLDTSSTTPWPDQPPTYVPIYRYSKDITSEFLPGTITASTLYSTAAWERLCVVARGHMSWEEYESGPVVHRDMINGMFYTLLQSVDILCTTPSLSCQDDFKTWKDKAKGIAVDEAGNISRPDLYCVWGNTLLPCAMGGDDRQFAPPNQTQEDEKDSDGNHLNRFGRDARISALEFFRASGWPTFRLRVQLRMARGLFDTCHREVYSDLPFSYGSGSDLVNHGVGLALERYLRARFRQLRPSPAGSLREVFFHCQGTTCIVDEVTRSKRNPDQVENALEFLCDLVRRSCIRASNIAIICPYKANALLVERRRREPQYSVLSAMPLASTVDSFQGREADIIVVIMGTTQRVGPGFTTDKRRLNVMLSRQRSGLLIFGDIDVLGPIQGEVRGKSFLNVDQNGNQQFMRRGMLYNVLRKLHDQGRVVTLSARAGRGGW